MLRLGRTSDAHPMAIMGAVTGPTEHHPGIGAAALTTAALAGGSSSLTRQLAGTAIDAGGLLPDLQPHNSWTQKVQDIDTLELLEVQLANATAPFILISRLRPSMAASPARRTYIVNVSAMEGQFSRRYQGPGHPAYEYGQAALNMLTRTSAQEMFEKDGILMTAVDTGWITDERPHPTKLRLAEGASTPRLTLSTAPPGSDDPIVQVNAARTCMAVSSRTSPCPLVTQPHRRREDPAWAEGFWLHEVRDARPVPAPLSDGHVPKSRSRQRRAPMVGGDMAVGRSSFRGAGWNIRPRTTHGSVVHGHLAAFGALQLGLIEGIPTEDETVPNCSRSMRCHCP